MKRIMERIMISLLSITLVGSAVACSSGGSKQGSSTNGSSGNPATSSPNNTTPASAKPVNGNKVTITSIDGTWASPIPAPDGEGVKKINEKFNVDFKPQFVPFDEYETKLPVVMAAGDIPDVIGMEEANTNFVKWAKQGAFLPLNDYIDKYKTLKEVPQYIWDAVTVDGKIYAIPQYFPAKYLKKPIIRKDWLDNLGLKMPTNYEELKKVAIAFTKDDPDKNGKNDTYGLGMAKKIVYGAWMNIESGSGWYNKNEQGQLIPGGISEGNKKQIQLLADLYKEGAIHKDWAVSKVGDVRNDFFAGKIGIFYEQPYSIGETSFQTLKQLNPTAELAVIPPFEQDDGQTGFLAGSGYYQLVAINSKLKGDTEKIERILQIEDYFRTFIPVGQRNPDSPDFDWQKGGEGKGYKMVNGIAIDIENSGDLHPNSYITNRYWAPDDEANELDKVVTDPLFKSFVQSAVNVLKTSKFYIDPVNRIHSPLLADNGTELDNILIEHKTKMIVGQESVSDWDKMVDEYMNKGGKAVIDEVNDLLNKADIKGEWK